MASRCDRYHLILGLLIAVYILLLAGLAFDLHTGLRTHKSDLGQMAQALWNTSRGRFVESIQDDFLSSRLTDHVEPIFVLIAPALWLWQDARALLLVQVLAVALAAWPLFELARRRLGPALALALAIAYLLDPHLQSAVLTEFHAIPLAAPLIVWAFWAIEAKRWGQFLVAALLVAAVKEEAALLAAGLGVWALYRSVKCQDPRITHHAARSTPYIPLAVLGISLLWFYLATFVIVPAHAAPVHGSAESAYFQRYGVLGDSPLDIFTSILTRPGLVWQIASEPARVQYLIGLLAPFGFLGLLAPEILLLTLPVLLANLLSAYPAQYYGEFHYSAPLVPFFAVAALYGAARLRGWLARAGLKSLGTALLILWLLLAAGWRYTEAGRGPLGGRYDPTPITSHHRLLPGFVAQIPADAAVTATAAVHPHVSLRRFVYQFPLGLDAATPAAWALLDVTAGIDMAPGDLKREVDAMLAADWGVVDAADGILLLRRDAPEKTIPPAFYDFIRVAADPVAAAPLRLAGVMVDDWPRWRQTKIRSQWQVGTDFRPGAVRPWLELRSPGGEVLYTFDASTPTALIWLPPEQWQPGDLITIETLGFFLPRVWGVAAGVVHGPDPSEPAHRLPTTLIAPGLPATPDGALALAAAYQRDEAGQLQALPLHLLFDPNGFGGLLGPGHPVQTAFFRRPDGRVLTMQVWPPTHPLRPAAAFDVYLRWSEPLPAGVTPFLHLRQNGANIAQSDGLLHVFIPSMKDLPPTDWRQLTLPADFDPSLPLHLVIGLYRPANGSRLDLITPAGDLLGNELDLGILTPAPALVPDQTCALAPPTCASQP